MKKYINRKKNIKIFIQIYIKKKIDKGGMSHAIKQGVIIHERDKEKALEIYDKSKDELDR